MSAGVAEPIGGRGPGSARDDSPGHGCLASGRPSGGVDLDRAAQTDVGRRAAIRRYPRQYVTASKTRDGVPVTIRPIRPEDEPLMVRFHQALSDETVHARYFGFLKLSERTAHERLARLCFIDYHRVMALVAEHTDPAPGEPEIVAVGRLIKAHGAKEAEFALLVADAWQRRGLGGELLRLLIGVGRDESLARIRGDILASNAGMLRVSQRLGFTLRRHPQTDTIEATISL